jgi:hypothetical protein
LCICANFIFTHNFFFSSCSLLDYNVNFCCRQISNALNPSPIIVGIVMASIIKIKACTKQFAEEEELLQVPTCYRVTNVAVCTIILSLVLCHNFPTQTPTRTHFQVSFFFEDNLDKSLFFMPFSYRQISSKRTLKYLQRKFSIFESPSIEFI